MKKVNTRLINYRYKKMHIAKLTQLFLETCTLHWNLQKLYKL